MKNNICKDKYINNSECNRNNEDINLDIESNENNYGNNKTIINNTIVNNTVII